MSVAYLMVALFGLLLLGVPVSVALGISAISALYFFTSYNIIGSAEIMFNGLKPALMAIPMFILSWS